MATHTETICDVKDCGMPVNGWRQEIGGSRIDLKVDVRLRALTLPGWTGAAVIEADLCKIHLDELLSLFKKWGLEPEADI